MFKRLMLCTVAVLCVSYAVIMEAEADLAIPEPYVRDVPGAKFDLTSSASTANALDFTIIPAASGQYDYVFSLSSDVEKITVKASRDFLPAAEEYTEALVYTPPEAGKTLNYTLTASFTLGSKEDFEEKKDEKAKEYKDTPAPDTDDGSNGGSSSSCSLFSASDSDLDITVGYPYGVVDHYIKASYSKSITIRNVGGSITVLFE